MHESTKKREKERERRGKKSLSLIRVEELYAQKVQREIESMQDESWREKGIFFSEFVCEKVLVHGLCNFHPLVL